ncbi:MAG: FimV/HubP family polar landmark protein, partial [Pseudomonadota bacterium]
DQVPAGAAPPQPRPTTEPVTFDEEPGLLSNPLILGGGALVLLGLGGLGFMLYRRRQSTGDEPSYAVSDDDALFADIGAAAEADADMEPDDGADEASADAADLEASLKAELADDPGNAQTHLRLLRQYYADESTEKFVAAAAAMKETVGETHPAWMEVRSMGAKLAPADALFGDAGDPSADSGETQIMMTTPPPTPAADLGDDDDIDLDLDLGDDAITDDSTREIPAQAVAAADAEEDFDFDLDLDLEGDDDDLPDLEFNLDDDEPEDVIEQAAEAVEDAAEDVVDELDEGLEFNLDDLDLPGADTEVEAPADAESTGGDTGADDDDMSLDFDLSDIDLPEVDEAEAEEAEISAEPDLSDLEIEEELPSVDHLNETVEPLSEQESADLDDLELDLEGIGVDLNDTGEAEPLETEGDRTEFELEALDVGQDAGDVAGMDTAEMELDLGLDDDDGEDVDLDDLELSDTELFAGEESAGTKLDLARAYIEMGDPDGARGMLEEVLAEGSDEQKSEAQQLMDGLEG